MSNVTIQELDLSWFHVLKRKQFLNLKDKKISHWESVFFFSGQENNFVKDLSLDKKGSSRVVSVTDKSVGCM